MNVMLAAVVVLSYVLKPYAIFIDIPIIIAYSILSSRYVLLNLRSLKEFLLPVLLDFNSTFSHKNCLNPILSSYKNDP